MRERYAGRVQDVGKIIAVLTKRPVPPWGHTRVQASQDPGIAAPHTTPESLIRGNSRDSALFLGRYSEGVGALSP